MRPAGALLLVSCLAALAHEGVTCGSFESCDVDEDGGVRGRGRAPPTVIISGSGDAEQEAAVRGTHDDAAGELWTTLSVRPRLLLGSCWELFDFQKSKCPIETKSLETIERA